MKKLQLLAGALLVASASFAQSAVTSKAFTAEKVATPTKVLSNDKSTPIWSDDFSDASTWVIAHDETQCSLDWEIGTGLECGGAYQIETIASTTYGNGCAMVDSDEYGGEEGGADVEDSWFTTASPINLADYNNVVLQFETWYQSYNSERCFVVTSTNNSDWPELDPNFDASTNSNVYEVFPALSGNAGDNTGTNPALWRMNISESAGNQEQVWVRFHWTGTWGYAWFIDDAAILEQPADDIVLNSGWITNGGGVEYGRIPASQMNDTLIVGGEVFNFGVNDQTNVNVNVIVTDESGNEVITVSASQALLENDSTSYIESYVTDFTPLAVGNYSLSVTASSDMDNAGGENFSNNSYNRNFAVTENLYSLDGLGVYDNETTSLTSLGSNSFTDNYDGLVLMAYYNILETTEVSGLEIGITTSSNEDAMIFPFILSAEAYNNDDMFDRIVENEDGVMITQGHIDNNLVFVSLPSTTLEPGEYFACVELYSDDINHVRILDDETVAQPSYASSIFLPSDETIYSNGNAFVIRLGLDDYVAIEENTVETFSIFPNPSNGIFTVKIAEAATYSVEVLNVLGETVELRTIEGSINETFDMTNFEAGLYFVKVSNGASVSTQRVIIK